MFKKKVADFSELVMFKHSVFSLPFIFIAMIVASDGWFGWRLFLLGLVAAVSARNFAMGVNRYLDRDVDAINPRTASRPSVDGRLKPTQVLLFTLINALIFIFIAYLINPLALKLATPILLILAGYTLFKRFSAMAHLVLGVSLGLAPIAGVVAVNGTIPTWSLYLSAGVVFWVAGFDLLYSLQDMEFDKSHGLHSMPSKFGAQKSMWIARSFHILSVALWAMFTYEANGGAWAWIAVGISLIALSYEHYIVSKDFTKIDKAFFTVNGYLGFAYLFCIAIDTL